MLNRTWIGLVAVALVAVISGGRAASAQAPAAPEPAKPVFTLNGEVAVITMLIKPDKTADFELVLSRLKDALQNSENPRRREQAAGWSVFKSAQLLAPLMSMDK